MNNKLEAALAYKSRGWSVIPLKRDKKPLFEWRTYQTRHATDDEIKTWWTQWPTANVGIVTGEVSHIIVLDVDGAEGEKTLKDRKLNISPTATSRTGGGWHYFFKHPGFDCRNFAGKAGKTILPGIDFRADGGFVVGPPSIHQNGNPYKWVVPLEDGLADPPAWLLNLIRNQRGGEGRRLEPEEWSAKIREGRRNDELTRRAGSLLAKMPPGEALSMLKTWNENHNEPPLPDTEVERIVESIARAERLKKDSSQDSQIHNPMDALMMNEGKLPFIKLRDIKPEKTRFTVENFLPTGYISLIFGDSGMGKSYLALYLASCLASGTTFLGRATTKGEVVYIDFELDEKEQALRAWEIAQGLGLEAPPENLLYLSPGQQEDVPTSLEALVGALKKSQTETTKLIIFDSLGVAIEGDAESAKDVCKLFKQLRGLGTVLLLDHQSKLTRGENYSQKTAFGSVYKQNLSRNVWQLKVVSSEPGEAKCILYHKKSNFTALSEPVGLCLAFGSETFTVDEIELGEEFAEHLGTKEKVLAAFKALEEATAEEIAEEAGVNLGSARNVITTLKARGQIKDTGRKRNKAIVYALPLDSSQLHTIVNEPVNELFLCSRCGKKAATIENPLFTNNEGGHVCRTCLNELENQR